MPPENWKSNTHKLLAASFLALGTLAPAALADDPPTGLPPSPNFNYTKFTQPMPRLDLLTRNPISALDPPPMEQANTTQQAVDPLLGGGTGPIEGRPPGPIWAHQGWTRFPPLVAIEATMEGAKVNTTYNPGVPQSLNSNIDPANGINPRFQPNAPDQSPLKVWTFNGTFPPKLALGRYHEPILFRLHNKLPVDKNQNGGFGIHSISVHEHNGHHGAENDGFTGAYFFPNQFYDYHWPIVLAGFTTINTGATDDNAATPDDLGGKINIPGDWRETMSTHWFHDHMFAFTSQNVYKGMAAMFNLYSAKDRGNEAIDDDVNLRLPSGTAKSWGNLDFDVNLMLADKAWNSAGQLAFNKFDFDGFLGDRMTVNGVDRPYFEVEARKYRFRILNAAVARFFKIALSDGSPMILLANDGNLLPAPIVLTELDQMGVAERWDIVIDFSRYTPGPNTKIHMVNLTKQRNGKKPDEDLSLQEALQGDDQDPVVGKFLEFRVVRAPTVPDVSEVPGILIPNPVLPAHTRTRRFEFTSGGEVTTPPSQTNDFGADGEWGIETDNGDKLIADYGRISAGPAYGTTERWILENGGGGWDHPIHIHFEEGQITARNGSANQVPAWEKGRKDVYRLRPGGTVTIKMQFRDWGGMFMEHCHNTTHEDHSMLLRWELSGTGSPFLRPLPTPIATPQGVTFVPPAEILPTAF
ncbi:MAG: multicopper oxidase domain-containing protein [Acidobacteriota bacterium]|nr:multicopper oxidase domain-containing protein [Acidobacteriota bacterium]